MAIAAGTRLGVYEIVAVLGAGGMGEVYRARDTRLGREFAIKTILEAFAADADRIARFQREAKLLASLNHPHIAALYGLEEAGDQHFLVMELVEGQTLADRLTLGPLEPGETVAIAIQIADALDAAHEKGVVHRDLKPGNIKVTPDDRVKVLDFGLAKAVETEATSSNAANSPTLSMMASQAGIILGTAAYMSPEQAKGLGADHRSDIFSFGSVLFEMLTGRRPFQGDTAPEVLASVLVREADLARLPPDLNPRLVELIRRCLEKQPKRRWQAIGDVRAELEAIAASPRTQPATVLPGSTRRPLWRRAWPAVASALAVGALAAAAAWTLKPEPPAPLVRFSFALSPQQQRATAIARRLVAVSPDGTVVAYAADRRLNVRRVGELQSVPLQGTEAPDGVMVPAFSPDGGSLAFYSVTENAIKRIALSGGGAATLCSVTGAPFGLSWGPGGIVFAQVISEERSVRRVPASGGAPQVIASLQPNELPEGPVILPDGDTVLVTAAANTRVGTDRWDYAQIIAVSIKSGTRKVIVDGGSDGRYLTSGHIAYAIGGTVYAAPFDVRTLSVTGTAFPIIEGVRRAGTGGSTGMADFSVSDNGTLVYVPGPAGAAGGVGLALVDWTGATTLLNLPTGHYSAPRLSRDGRHIALESSDGRETFIGVFDRDRTAGLRRITFGGNAASPIWSPDGSRVAFQSAREGDAAIFAQSADGSGAPVRLTRPAAGEAHVPQSWFGDVLLFDVAKPGVTTLWQFSFKDRSVAPFGGVRSSTETGATFSPDGRWVLYSATDQSTNAFVQPYPATGAKFMLVKLRASAPHHVVWTPDGSAVIETPSPGQIERVPVTTAPSFSFGTPEMVPRMFQGGPPGSRRLFDMAPDGRILGLVTPEQVAGVPQQDQVVVVLNWFQELRSRARQ
jgi:eukaryotic-like serine/threonine-protein kinase